MEFKTFREFLNEEYRALAIIRQIDEAVIKPMLKERRTLTEAEIKAWENKQQLIMEDEEAAYMANDEVARLCEVFKTTTNDIERERTFRKLLKNFEPMLHKIAKSCHPKNFADEQDMVAVGMKALWDCIEKYDPAVNNSFVNFSWPTIAGLMRNTRRTKSISDGKGDSYGNNRMYGVSFDAPVAGPQGEWADKEQTVADKLADETTPRPDDFQAEELGEHVTMLHDWYEQLPEDEKKAVMMYFPTDYDKKRATYDEIGEALNMSKVGAMKLIDRIVIKLKKVAEKMGLSEGPDLEKIEKDVDADLDIPAEDKEKVKEFRKQQEIDKFYKDVVKMAKGKKE